MTELPVVNREGEIRILPDGTVHVTNFSIEGDADDLFALVRWRVRRALERLESEA